jgi:aspartyl-tRNA(Asn)/glutamyl-tRNA(Gln) amidotransferase subunit A
MLHSIYPYLREETHPEVQQVFEEALGQLGEAVQSHDSLSFSLSTLRSHHAIIMAIEAADVHGKTYKDLPDAFAPKVSALIEKGLSINAQTYQDSLSHQRMFRQSISKLLQESPLLIMPTAPTTAPSLDSTGDPSFNSPWSYAGLPTVSIPCGVSPEGLPVGLQIIARHDCEEELLAAAAWCEERFEFRQHWSPVGCSK